MKTRALLLSSMVLALAAQGAFAQAGAGGRGGSGAGAEGPGLARADVAFVNKAPAKVYDVRTSAPPPMDPSRRINVVDCRLPFDPYQGNIQCR
jgi:hypothetical protein